MESFERDLEENIKAIDSARQALASKILQLSDGELTAMRRGGWSVREVVRHVIDAEVAYAKVIGFLRSQAVELSNASDADVASPDAAVAALRRARECVLRLVDGIDEATFYDLRALGKEQYSVVSVLENIASHDHEHLEQIAKTVAATKPAS